MKRTLILVGSILFLAGSFFFQTSPSFAASAHTNSSLSNAGGLLVRGTWISPTTFAFLASDIQSGGGHIEVYQGSQTVGVAYFGPEDNSGYVIGTVSIGWCNDPNHFYWSARVFDGQAGEEFAQTISSCTSFAPAPYGPDTCVNGYVWREAFSNDHVCVAPSTRSQAAYDNSQAASRVNPNGPYGPNTCINGYVWREANSTDFVCVSPSNRSLAAYDNSQALYRKLDLGF